MKRPILVVAAVNLAIVNASACAFTPSAPVSAQTPAVSLDVDAERKQLEDAVCADAGAAACDVLTALDETDDGVAASPPRFPQVLPSLVRHLDHVIDVAPWIESQRQVHDFLPQIAVPIDLGDIGGTAGDLLQGARILDARLMFADDELTIDLPALEIGIAHPDPDGVDGALGAVDVIGVLPAHAGGSGEDAPLSLREGGSQALLAALAAGDASVVVRPAADAHLGFLAGPDADSLLRPGGAAELSLAVTLSISKTLSADVSLSGL